MQTSILTAAFTIGSVLMTMGFLATTIYRSRGIHGRFYLAAGGALLFYYAGLGFAAWKGLLSDFSSFPPPLLFPLVMLPLASFLLFVFSRPGRALISQHSLRALTLVQVFRFFPEIMIALLILDGVMPETMTVTGRNFDLFAPLTAPLAALFFAKKEKLRPALLLVWNTAAAAILINTVVTALLSMPTPARVFFTEPALTAPAQFPYYLLPSFYVPLAFALHAASIWKILQTVKQR